MKIEYILPVIALLVGWFLKEAETFFKSRRGNRTAISRAIAELLELHHGLNGYKYALESVRKNFNVPMHEMWSLRQMLLQHLLMSDISKRYERMVTQISSYDPLLAFKLRNKTSVIGILESVEKEIAPGGYSQAAFYEMEAKLIDVAVETLKDTIISLARKHGYITWFKVRKYLSKPRKYSADSEEVMQMASQAVQKLHGASTTESTAK